MSLSKACFAFFTGGFLLLAFCRSGLAQEVQLKNDPTLPLQIVSVSPQLSNGASALQAASITVRNTGVVPCVAFTVSVLVELSNSTTDRVNISHDFNAFGYLNPHATHNQLAPGQTYTLQDMGSLINAPDPGITVTGFTAQVDFVKTNDGKLYGADPNKAGLRYQMVEHAHRSERRRLLAIYNSGGISALLNELQR